MATADPDTEAGGVEHLVVLVHGINTNAQWFPVIKKTLEEAGFTAVPAGYGIYGVVRFLIPILVKRRDPVIGAGNSCP
jgi:hypothetical protein